MAMCDWCHKRTAELKVNDPTQDTGFADICKRCNAKPIPEKTTPCYYCGDRPATLQVVDPARPLGIGLSCTVCADGEAEDLSAAGADAATSVAMPKAFIVWFVEVSHPKGPSTWEPVMPDDVPAHLLHPDVIAVLLERPDGCAVDPVDGRSWRVMRLTDPTAIPGDNVRVRVEYVV